MTGSSYNYYENFHIMQREERISFLLQELRRI